MADVPTIDPFQRAEIIAWLTANQFVDYDGHGYFDRCYALGHSYPCMRVGVPEAQNCATVALSDGDLSNEERRTVYLGEAYTVPAIAALWAVLNLFDYHDSRNSAFWERFHRQSALRQEAEKAGKANG